MPQKATFINSREKEIHLYEVGQRKKRYFRRVDGQTKEISAGTFAAQMKHARALVKKGTRGASFQDE